MTENLTHHYTEILKNLGENPEREGLQRTPERAAKAMQFLTSGYEADLKTLINGAVFSSDTDEMVIVRDIEFYSLCEHHLLPFYGHCHVAYLPQGKVIGLSKIPRIVDVFARRLQIQEQLTYQIAEAIQLATNAAGVAVVMNAQHFCMKMRGVQKQNASMTTSVMLGVLKEDVRARTEFLNLVK